jgi:hypothetical protein
MTLKTFEKLIANMKADRERTRALLKLDVDVISYAINDNIVDALGLEAFGKEGWGWIEWFCWETDFGESKDMVATDADKNPICYDVPSLWECVSGLQTGHNDTT